MNVHVSKCRGRFDFQRSRWLDEATNGIGLLIGPHVGETAILSAAGRLVAASADPQPLVEGSFGALLFADDIEHQTDRFGRAGIANVLGGVGLGVDIDESRLCRYSSTVRLLAARKERAMNAPVFAPAYG